MTANTLTIAAREVTEKKFVFAAAAAFALLAVLAPLAPGVHLPVAETTTIAAGLIAAGFALGLATILGATVIGRELSDNRLSFYFARPVPAASIWFGKLLGSAVLIGLSFAIVMLPTLAATPAVRLRIWGGNMLAFLTAVALASAVLFFAAHVIGTMARSRSPWIAVDFLCAAGVAAAAQAMVSIPQLAMAVSITLVVASMLAIGGVLAVVGAGAWQLSHGRTDRRRSHLELSRFLWGSMALVLLVTAGYTLWAMSPSPSDLVEVYGGRAAGGWALISGKAKGRGDYEPSFLVNGDGRTVRILAPAYWGADFAGDGKSVAWMRPTSFTRREFEIVRCRLDVPAPMPEPTGIIAPPNRLALSDDGRRVIVGQQSFSIYDLDTKRSLGSFRVDVAPSSWSSATFAGNDAVRVFVQSRRAGNSVPITLIYEYNLAAHALRQSGSVFGYVASVSADALRMLVTGQAGSRSLADARTGATLAPLTSGTAVRFLADGSIAAVELRGGGAFLRHFDPHGAPLGEVALGQYAGGLVAGGDSHRVIVQLRTQQHARWSLASVSLDRGAIERTDATLHGAMLESGRPLPNEILCVGGTGIVAWNPASGAKRVVAGRS
jgi:hypothetical protein